MATQIYQNKQAETASVDELRSIQLKGLKHIAKHVYTQNTVFRKKFDALGVSPDEIKNLDDICKLPIMDKEDLRENYPMGLSCVDSRDVVEMHMSSGSTGTPIVMPYTAGDLDQWAECMARCYRMAGAMMGDPVQITPSFGLFNGGFGFYHGARKAGLFVIPTGAGNTARQVRLARDFKTRVITAVVSYGIRVMEIMDEEKSKLPDLKIGIFGAETFTDGMKEKIQKAWASKLSIFTA